MSNSDDGFYGSGEEEDDDGEYMDELEDDEGEFMDDEYDDEEYHNDENYVSNLEQLPSQQEEEDEGEELYDDFDEEGFQEDEEEFQEHEQEFPEDEHEFQEEDGFDVFDEWEDGYVSPIRSTPRVSSIPSSVTSSLSPSVSSEELERVSSIPPSTYGVLEEWEEEWGDSDEDQETVTIRNYTSHVSGYRPNDWYHGFGAEEDEEEHEYEEDEEEGGEEYLEEEEYLQEYEEEEEEEYEEQEEDEDGVEEEDEEDLEILFQIGQSSVAIMDVDIREEHNQRIRGEEELSSQSAKRTKIDTSRQSNTNDADGNCCSICMQPWSSEGDHQVSCLPCGHVYGLSCIKRWIEHCGGNSKCPQCKRTCGKYDIIKLYVSGLGVANEEQQKNLSLQSEYDFLQMKFEAKLEGMKKVMSEMREENEERFKRLEEQLKEMSRSNDELYKRQERRIEELKKKITPREGQHSP